MARHLSGREHAGLQHGVLANPSPGGKTGGAGRRTRVCRSVGNLGAVSYLAVALRFLRTPLPAARPADGGIRFSAEFPVLAGAGPVPPALLRHGGTNHVQRKRFHSSSAFFHLPGFGTHAPALDTPFIPPSRPSVGFLWRPASGTVSGGASPLSGMSCSIPPFRPPFCWERVSSFIMGR